jgi:putative membrane protein
MALDILLLAVAGVVGGVFTGLVPGIHPNTLSGLLLSVSSGLLLLFTPQAVVVFIIAMGITHTFLSFLPSVYLGAPDETSTVLSVLPGHRLLLEGKGYEAVYLTVTGGVGVVLFSLALFPLLLVVLPVFYAAVRSYISYILIGMLVVMVSTEKGVNKKLKALFVLLMAGVLGFLSLNTPALSGIELLFPIFTGMFGISTLIISMFSGFRVPKQRVGAVVVERFLWLKGVLKGFLSGLIVGILPGIGPSQAAVLAHQAGRKINTREFLVSLGGINTVAALFSLMALYLISKPRSGLAIAVQKILKTFGFSDLLLLVFTAVFATGVAAVLTLKVAKYFSLFVQRIDYKKLSFGVIIFLVVMVGILTGGVGLLLLFTSTAIGMLPPLFGIKRTHGMGVLMVPLVFWFLGMDVIFGV